MPQQGQLFDLDLDDATLKRSAEAKAAEDIAKAAAKAKAPSFFDRLREAYTANPTGQLGATGPAPILAKDSKDEADRLAAAKLVANAVDAGTGLPNVPKPAPDLMGAITAPLQPPAGPLPTPVARSPRMAGTGGSGPASGPMPAGPGDIRTAPVRLDETPSGPAKDTRTIDQVIAADQAKRDAHFDPRHARADTSQPESDTYATERLLSEAKGRQGAEIASKFLPLIPILGPLLAQGLHAYADAPTQELAQRAKALQDLQERGSAKTKAEREAAQYDEGSPMSQTATKLARVQGLIKPGEKIAASMWPMLKEGASLQEAREQHAAQIKDLGEQRRLTERGQNIQLQMERERTAAERAGHEGKVSPTSPGSEIAPGYTVGNIPIKPEEAASFRGAVAARNDLTQSAARLKQLLAQHGTESFNTDAGREMRQLASEMKLKMKDLAKLGALSGSDLDLLESQIPNPNSMVPESIGNNQGALDAFTKGIDRSLASQARSMGLQTAGGGEGGAHPEASQAAAWAKAHPGDPRAQAILQRVGGA